MSADQARTDAAQELGAAQVDLAVSTRMSFRTSTLWSGLAQLGIKATTAGSALLLAFMLTPTQYGLAMAALSLGLIFGVLLDTGFSVAVVRQLSSAAWGPWTALDAALTWRRWAVIPIGGLTLVATALSPHLGGLRLGPVIVFYMIATSFASLGAAMLNGLHEFRASTVAVVVGRVLGCGLLAVDIAVGGPASPAWAVLLTAVGETMTAGLSFRTIRRFSSADVVHTRVGPARSLRATAPFALSTFFSLVYNRADVYMVTVFAGTQVAGIYAPGSQLQNALMVLPGIAGAATIPVGTRLLAQREWSGVVWLVRSALRLSVILTLPTCVLLWLALPRVLAHTLGSSYAPAAGPARLLLLSLPFLALQIPLMGILTAASPRSATVVYGLGLVCCLTAHAVLDRAYGPTGAAVAALSREPVILTGAVFALRRYARRVRT